MGHADVDAIMDIARSAGHCRAPHPTMSYHDYELLNSRPRILMRVCAEPTVVAALVSKRV
eukprot:2005313-Amphidinium_carterae.1